jgi:hypothetical protein
VNSFPAIKHTATISSNRVVVSRLGGHMALVDELLDRFLQGELPDSGRELRDVTAGATSSTGVPLAPVYGILVNGHLLATAKRADCGMRQGHARRYI